MEKKSKKITSIILSKTLVFIFVVLFVTLFKYVFGAENSLIGVTTIVLTLALLERDLTGEFIKNLVYLSICNLILGLGAFIAWENIWLGIAINFSIMFFIGYIFSYELRKSMNMLFGLHYILMMTTPIKSEQLPMRLLALICGAFIIMAAQLLVNKNKLAKSSDKTLNDIADGILKKIVLLKEDKDLAEINLFIDTHINKLKIIILDSSGKNFSITKTGKNAIHVLSCLEKINILLDTIYVKEADKDLLDDIYAQLTNIIEKRFNKATLEAMVSKYKNDSEKLNRVYKFTTTLEILYKKIEESKSLQQDEKNNLSLQDYFPEDFRRINIHKRNINMKSNRVAYGIRLGLLVTITTFIKNYFNLEFGNWMIYTVFALTQPHAEFTRVKSKKRIAGTVIGALIVFALFHIVHQPSMRTVILLATGYLMGYVSDYMNVVIFVTITSIASASVNVPNPNYIIMNRLMFVSVGIIISLIANKLILHRKYKDEEINLRNIQKEISKRIQKEVLETEVYNENSVESLYLIQALIENRIEILNLSIEKEVLLKNKMLLNDIHQIHLVGNEMYAELINQAKNIISNSLNKNIALGKLKEFMENTEDMREKALLKTICECQ